MTDATQAIQPNGPYFKTALTLWVLALCGAILILPYVAALEHIVLAAGAARMHLRVWELLALSVVQSSVLLAIAVFAGLWASRKLGLRTPIITAVLTRTAAPKGWRWSLLLALAIGIVMALAVEALDYMVFAPIPSVAELIRAAGTGSAKPNAWQSLLATFYGAFDEEILVRLGLMSLLALTFRTLLRILGRNREGALPSGVFWAANIIAAVLFGLGHLPSTAALAPLSSALVVRAILLNGTLGLVFGTLYRRYRLEWAMVSHLAVGLKVYDATLHGYPRS